MKLSAGRLILGAMLTAVAALAVADAARVIQRHRPGDLAAAPLGRSAAGPDTAPCAPAESAQVRLDHVPIAVADLEGATARYRDRLGFSIKPGRPHPNSLLNSHQKFRDGTQLELITATEPRDRTATDYVEFLKGGDGGAFLSLQAGRLGPVSRAIHPLEPRNELSESEYFDLINFPPGHPMQYVFFVRGSPSPTDRPEHFAHPNTAAGLYAVWLRQPDPSREVRMLERLGAAACPSALRLPIGPVRREIRLARGVLYLVPTPGTPSRRAIAGVTLRVADVDSARRALRLPPGTVREGRDARGPWLRIPPEHANGVWMELLQPVDAASER